MLDPCHAHGGAGVLLLFDGNAPQSHPFCKSVTEEVLPAIRKTGSFGAARSGHRVAQGVMDELKALLCRFCEVSRGLALCISSRDVTCMT